MGRPPLERLFYGFELNLLAEPTAGELRGPLGRVSSRECASPECRTDVTDRRNASLCGVNCLRLRLNLCGLLPPCTLRLARCCCWLECRYEQRGMNRCLAVSST